MVPRGSIRPPALAGTWYPADAELLRRSVAGFLRSARRVEGLAALDALVVPHAGHIYSGPTAGLAWGALGVDERGDAPWAGRELTRVVLLGPAHRVGFPGLALGDFEAFAHPLGETPVDRAALADLEALGLGGFVPGAHDAEHCLEIQLPFCALALPGRPIVPLLIGLGPEPALGQLVDAALTHLLRPGDLLVISSDLSHFRPYDEARRVDLETLGRIERLDERLDGERACGYKAIRAAIHRARHHHHRAALIDYRSSGDTAGDRRSVVGYGALAFGPAAA